MCENEWNMVGKQLKIEKNKEKKIWMDHKSRTISIKHRQIEKKDEDDKNDKWSKE